MIYKKIGDKIPSLSGLLLAGTVLFGSCKDPESPNTKNNKPDGAGETGTPNTSINSDPSKNGGGNGGNAIDNAYLGVLKKIYMYLIENVALIGRLSKEPEHAGNNAFQGGLQAKTNLEALCKSFVVAPFSQPYPEDLKNLCSFFQGLHFRTKSSKEWINKGLSQKFAYGTAINSIAKIWVEFHKNYKNLVQLIEQGAPRDQITELRNKLDGWFEKAVKSSDTVFKPSAKFFGSKKTQLPASFSLAKFLSDKNETGDVIGSDANGKKIEGVPFGMPSLLKETVKEGVWIKGASLGKKFGFENTPLNIGDIGKRGMGIASDWKVNGKISIDSISVFPGAGLIKYKCTNDGTLEDRNSADELEAPVLNEISFGQVLTTVFNGNDGLDFLSFSQEDPQHGWFDIGSKDSVFQTVYELALNNKNYDLFADALGNHIRNVGLEDVFYIPDYKDYMDKVIAGITTTGLPANTKNEYKSGEQVKASDIEDSCVSASLLKNFAAIFGKNGACLEDAFKLCVERVTNIEKLLESDVSFEEKLSAQVLQSILGGAINAPTGNMVPLIVRNATNSAETLIEQIKSETVKHLGRAIVYKDEEGKYRATTVSKKIQEWIVKMAEKLSARHNAAYITYQTLATHDSRKEEDGKFNIKKVVECMKSDYEAIKNILIIDLVPFLDNESLVLTTDNYKQYIPSLNLADKHIESINKLKLEYVNSKKDKKQVSVSKA